MVELAEVTCECGKEDVSERCYCGAVLCPKCYFEHLGLCLSCLEDNMRRETEYAYMEHSRTYA